MIVVRGLRLPVALQDAAVTCLRIAAVVYVARAIHGVMNTPALVRLHMHLIVAISSGMLVTQILFVPVVLYFGAGLPGAVMVSAVVACVGVVLHLTVAVRLLPSLKRVRIDRALMRQLAGFGSALVVSTIAGTITNNAEKLLLPRYRSIESLAYYSVACPRRCCFRITRGACRACLWRRGRFTVARSSFHSRYSVERSRWAYR